MTNVVTPLFATSFGFQWTYLVFSLLPTGAAVWFYAVDESTRHFTYASTVLIGCGMSGLIVMALAFVTGVIGPYKVCHQRKLRLISGSVRSLPATWSEWRSNKYTMVCRCVDSYLPRFTSSHGQNAVDSWGAAEWGINEFLPCDDVNCGKSESTQRQTIVHLFSTAIFRSTKSK